MGMIEKNITEKSQEEERMHVLLYFFFLLDHFFLFDIALFDWPHVTPNFTKRQILK
jgi:hypothetical protein